METHLELDIARNQKSIPDKHNCIVRDIIKLCTKETTSMQHVLLFFVEDKCDKY